MAIYHSGPWGFAGDRDHAGWLPSVQGLPVHLSQPPWGMSGEAQGPMTLLAWGRGASSQPQRRPAELGTPSLKDTECLTLKGCCGVGAAQRLSSRPAWTRSWVPALAPQNKTRKKKKKKAFVKNKKESHYFSELHTEMLDRHMGKAAKGSGGLGGRHCSPENFSIFPFSILFQKMG